MQIKHYITSKLILHQYYESHYSSPQQHQMITISKKKRGGGSREDKPRQVAMGQFEKVTCQQSRIDLSLDQEILSSFSTPLHFLPGAIQMTFKV